MTNIENPNVQAALTELGNHLNNHPPPDFTPPADITDPQTRALAYMGWVGVTGARTDRHAVTLIAAAHALAIHTARRPQDK